MFSLNGKCALVTGATGGIGGAIAKALHAQGATVGISGRNEAKLNELAAELKERVFVLPADLSSKEAAEALVKAAEEKMEKVDILVNNAGLTRDGLSMRMKDEDWQQVIDVNMTATFKLAQACQRGMMKRRWGRIVNVASVVGVTGNPGQCNYVASKAGMIGWSKAMAAEIASRNITVNVVAPGYIETAMTAALGEEAKGKLTSVIALERLGTVDDIAAAVVYLASEEASYVTGQVLNVSGGLYI